MSAPTKDGGPAFPEVLTQQEDLNHSFEVYSKGGMTLRDYFAAQAVGGLTANGGIAVMKPSDYAANGYLIADAMLKERAK